VSIYGEYSGRIFDTDLSAVAATYIHWRLPGLGSRVAVTVSSQYTLQHVLKYPPKHVLKVTANYTGWHTSNLLHCTLRSKLLKCSQDALKTLSRCFQDTFKMF